LLDSRVEARQIEDEITAYQDEPLRRISPLIRQLIPGYRNFFPWSDFFMKGKPSAMNDWIIRECRAEEAEAVLAMWREAGASPSVSDSVADIRRAILQSPARFLVAEARGKLIGSVIGSFDGWRANFYRLAVIPEYRRQGLARALVAEIEKWLIQQGAKKIGALVENDRPGSMAFWQAAGYCPDPRIIRYVKIPKP
jgi:ribosomal protein S18 acetylase RimI-like enzyme